MQAYNEGFNACSGNSNSNSAGNDNSDLTSGNSNSARNDNSESSDIESGTGRMMNLCNKISMFLVQSCDALVNSDDALTQNGIHARSCIENGALLAGGVWNNWIRYRNRRRNRDGN